MSEVKPAAGSKIWRDGRIVEWEDATIHIMSHVAHYGTGVFEGVRAYDTPNGPALFRIRDHMRRLLSSCRIHHLQVEHSVDTLIQAAVDTVAVNQLGSCYVRPLVVRTGSDLSLHSDNSPVETFVIARPWGTYLGEEGLRDGVDVCVSSWRRVAPDTIPALAKASGNYLSAQLAKREAKMNGYAEGIMLDTYGYVAEGSGENLFTVVDGVLCTTPLASGILHGITRASIMQLAEDMGIPVRIENMVRESLYLADEIFFTGTAAEVTPVRSVDKLKVGEGRPGPVTRKLQERFLGIVNGRLPDKFGWLTHVPRRAEAVA